MRESIGATWLMIIVLTFITLFSAYLAFSINYSKAFSLKDEIVEQIEKNNEFNEEAKSDISEYMDEISYGALGTCRNMGSKVVGILGDGTVDSKPAENDKYHYCVKKINSTNNESGTMSSSHYEVTVFFTLEIPIISGMFNFKIVGETKDIYFAGDSDNFFK